MAAEPHERPRRAAYGAAATIAVLAGVSVTVPSPFEEWFWSRLAPDRGGHWRAADPARRVPVRRVILISIDGLGRALYEGEPPPHLTLLARDGAIAVAESASDSTLQSHGTMISGEQPAASRFDRPSYRPWSRFRDPTLFDLCEREGWRCALVTGKEKLAALVRQGDGCEHFQRVAVPDDGRHARAVFEAALRYVRARDPDFVMVHVSDVDESGHRRGWGSPKQLQHLAEVDLRLGEFVAVAAGASARPLAVLVTADHGGEGTTHRGDAPIVREVPWILWGDGVPAEGLADRVSLLDTAPTVLALLGRAAPPEWQGRARVPAVTTPP